MNNHEGERLIPSIAKILIIELFTGQTKQLQEIKTKVEETHAERGGLPPTAQYSPVPRALRELKESGIAENPRLGYWSIQSNEDKGIKTLDAFIKWANKFNEGEFVFRGVPNEEYKIQASAFRRPDKSKRQEENEKDFVRFLHCNKDLIREAKQRGYNNKDGTEMSIFDILAQLQHFKAATCLIDFTYSAQVALWFACQPDTKNQKDSETPLNGKVYAVKHKPPRASGLPKIQQITPDFWETDDDEKKDISYYLKENQDSTLYYLQPKYQNERIIAQQSVFLFGQFEFAGDDECVIAAEHKEKILKELHRVSGITEDKLFPDFEGFAWVHREESPYTVSTFSALKDQGRREFENKRYNYAIEDFTRAIDIESGDQETYNLRGKAYTHLGNFEKALEDYDEAIRLNPDYAESYLNRGTVYYHQKNYEVAHIDYDKAISLDEDCVEAYYQRGLTRINLNQYKEAIEDFDVTLTHRPNSPYVYYYLGLGKYLSDREEEALEDFAKAIELNPDYVEAYFYRGLTNYGLMLFERAILDFDKVIELNPNNEVALYHRAEVKSTLRRYTEAKQDLDIAIEFALQNENDTVVRDILILLDEIDNRLATEAKDE